MKYLEGLPLGCSGDQEESVVILVTNKCNQDFELAVGRRTMRIQFTNHLELLRQLLVASDDSLIVSPFLFRDCGPLLADLPLRGSRIELITTCAPRGDDQLLKPFALRSFGREFESATGNWPSIGLDQSLHSKLYLFSRDGSPFAGIVTSANLTKNGLVENHETGILLTEEIDLRELSASARKGLNFVSLSDYQIGKLCDAAKAYGGGIEPIGNIDIGLSNFLNNYCTPSAGNRDVALRRHACYWIKVSGVTDRPILPENREPFNSPHCQLSFAKNPGNIALGDCLLEVAVGGKCFLSYYSCASTVYERTEREKREDPDNQRWPYYVFANNLSLNYGSSWFEQPIFYDDLVRKFKERFPNVAVTEAGKDHFKAAIQMGHSYILVTKEFGQFVRRHIDAFPAVWQE